MTMTKVHIYIRTTDGLGTDTKGLTIHELSPKESDEHYSSFVRKHMHSDNAVAATDGHDYVAYALANGVSQRHDVHVAKHNGEIVGAISHYPQEGSDKQMRRNIHNLGSIHPGAGHALLRHVADISEKEGSHLQGVPADARVRRLYNTLARRAGGSVEKVDYDYRLVRPKRD